MPHSESPSDWAMFIEMLHPQKGEKILDIGAGSGQKAAKVLETSQGSEVYAIDPNAKKVAEALAAHPAIKSSVARAEKLPFDDAYFDKAYSTMAFHHFANIDNALAEIARILKPRGSYVILEVEPGSMLGRTFRFLGRLMGERMTIMTEGECLARLRSKEGFEVVASASLGASYLVHLMRT